MKKIISIILTGLILLSVNLSSQEDYKELTLRDVWASGKFYPSMVQGIESLNDGLHYTVLEEGEIVKYAYESGEEVETMLSSSELIPVGMEEPIRFDAYYFSKDEKKILLATETESIYRYSSKSYFYIYDLNSEELIPLFQKGKQRLASFSPDGSKVAFVYENNIYIKDLKGKILKQVTMDGKDRHIINGTTDWVYEEEFAITQGIAWSEDSRKIAYYKFDESNVKEYFLTFWGDLYPEEHKYKYPKAGEDNSIVNIYVYHLDMDKSVKMDAGQETDQYIPRFYWTKDPEKLALLRMNRHQNKLEVLIAEAVDGKSKLVYNETNEYYIDITDAYTFLNDMQHLILTSEQDGFHHIYMHDMVNNQSRQLTDGNWDVVEFVGVDEKNMLVYYISNETEYYNKQLWVVDFEGKKRKLLTKEEGVHSVAFSKTFDYFIDTYSTANAPPKVAMMTSDGNVVKMLEENTMIEKAMEKHGFTKKEFFDFKTNEGVKLNGYMIKPPDFDKKKEYPVFMSFYGGPGSQQVLNSWGWFDFIWFQMLAQKGYIVVCVDNRGTGGRGEEFKKCTYLNLGKLETMDQIEVAKYLGGLKYVDKERLGVFGWSYGGYLSTLCMTKGADYFKAGIAVAPVTNWRYYDNIYTERFMRTPQENAGGYDDNSPINFVKDLKGSYLLVHGTADDNVHVQNAMDLIAALVNANKEFEMFLYPNKNHGIYGGYTRYHLYNKMTNFILENL